MGAVLVLAASAIIGAGAVLVLPRQTPVAVSREVSSPVRVLVTIWRSGPLRRALGLTIVVAFSVAALPIYAVAVAPSLGGAALAGVLVAGYGVGGLAGSVLLMVRPFKGDADRLTSVLSGGVAAALVVVVPASNLILALAAFTVVGVANSLFFAATLAARSEYSPSESRGQVFI